MRSCMNTVDISSAEWASLTEIAIDAPQDAINTMCGRLGRLDGITSKAAYSNVITKN